MTLLSFFILFSIFTLCDYIFHLVMCRIAKKTKKRVCKCWDCENKCDLFEHKEHGYQELIKMFKKLYWKITNIFRAIKYTYRSMR